MTTLPEPRQTSRDVSWSVMFRLARTSAWLEWSSGHRSPGEAIRSGEALVSIPSVADIRFERVTRTREMFDLRGIAQLADGEA